MEFFYDSFIDEIWKICQFRDSFERLKIRVPENRYIWQITRLKNWKIPKFGSFAIRSYEDYKIRKFRNLKVGKFPNSQVSQFEAVKVWKFAFLKKFRNFGAIRTWEFSKRGSFVVCEATGIRKFQKFAKSKLSKVGILDNPADTGNFKTRRLEDFGCNSKLSKFVHSTTRTISKFVRFTLRKFYVTRQPTNFLHFLHFPFYKRLISQ